VPLRARSLVGLAEFGPHDPVHGIRDESALVAVRNPLRP
jgi:hypothetical protein